MNNKSIIYRNIDITFPPDTDLLANRQDVDDLLRSLDEVFDKMHTKTANNVYQTNYATAIRLNNNDKLIIQIYQNGLHNPYIHLYNSKTKEISNTVPYNVLNVFKNTIFLNDLKDKTENIDNPLYGSIIDVSLQSDILQNAMEYDGANLTGYSLSHQL